MLRSAASPRRQRRQPHPLEPSASSPGRPSSSSTRRATSSPGHGEHIYHDADRTIGALIRTNRANRTLNETPMHFTLERPRRRRAVRSSSPARCWPTPPPTACSSPTAATTASSSPTWTARSVAVAGTGKEGKADGSFAKATFADPQGLAFDGDTAVRGRPQEPPDPRAGPEGPDRQDHRRQRHAGPHSACRKYGGQSVLRTGLNSPWGLLLHNQRLYIGMAGHHQIWAMDLAKHTDLALCRQRRREPAGRPAAIGQVRPAERPGHRRHQPVRRRQRGQRHPRRAARRPARCPHRRRRRPVRVRRRERPGQGSALAARPRRGFPQGHALRGRHLQQQDQADRPGHSAVHDLPGGDKEAKRSTSRAASASPAASCTSPTPTPTASASSTWRRRPCPRWSCKASNRRSEETSWRTASVSRLVNVSPAG